MPNMYSSSDILPAWECKGDGLIYSKSVFTNLYRTLKNTKKKN